MSTPSKYDLLLLGNIIVDNIYYINNKFCEGTSNQYSKNIINIGGLGNLISSLNGCLKIFLESNIGNDSNGQLIEKFLKDKKIKNKLYYSEYSTSNALILTNLFSNERTSYLNWGCGKEQLHISNNRRYYRWSHISYIDIIENLNIEYVKNKSKILSADLCLSQPSDICINNTVNKLKYLDYLFISESEIYSFIKTKSLDEMMNFVNYSNLQCLIFHTRYETFLIYKNYYKKIEGSNIFLKNINVLGAGDAYCANFIKYKLNNLSNDIDAAYYAHEQATKYLALNNNEKI